MVIFFDIETYSREPRGALNPISGEIITIQIRHQGRTQIWKSWSKNWSELWVIRAFLDFLSDHRKEPIVGDNLLRFDLPFILCRLIHHEGEIRAPGRYLLIYQRRWVDLYQILLDSYVSVKLKMGNRPLMAAAEGNGPVNAFDIALRQTLNSQHPELSKIKLVGYRVTEVDVEKGTAAAVQVFAEFEAKEKSWSTIGVSTNTLEASEEALVDSYVHYLYRTRNSEGSLARTLGRPKH